MIDYVFSAFVGIAPFACLLIIYALLFISPNRSQKSLNIKELNVGDKVITTGGIVGHIAKINQKSIVLENYDGSLIEITDSAVREKYL